MDAARGSSPRLGTVLNGRYQVADVLGRGPRGTVLAAVELATARPVALKVLDPAGDVRAPDSVRAAGAETIAGVVIGHPGLVDARAIGRLADERLYLVMDRVDGIDLATLLAIQPIPVAPALRILRQALGAIRAAHAAGVVHGDLKPANVVVSGIGGEGADAADEEVRVLDIALARLFGPPAVDPADRRYAAPEQLAGGAPSPRWDLHALGVILVEMLTGAPLAAGTPLDRTWPSEVAFLIWRALQREPRDRFRDAVEMIAGVDAALRSARA